MTSSIADAAPFPNYLQMRQWLPTWLWRTLACAAVLCAFATIGLLFADPHDGLIVWWLWILPVLPLTWVLAPGLWRNVCPMAMLNQLPRLLGFTRNRTVPGWLQRRTYLVQSLFYFSFISLRAPVFDHNGRATGCLMLAALVFAFVGGVVYKGKSGWCGTFCPLLPIQKLYGQTPLVVVPNMHCSTCVGCTKNCYDFNPRLSMLADMHDEDHRHGAQRKIFAGTFPGFVVAFFSLPKAPIAAPSDLGMSMLHYYGWMSAAMLASLGAYFLAEALLPVSATVLTAVFGGLGLNLHNILRFNTSFHVHKPTWILVVENIAVALVTVSFLIRTVRQERAALTAAEKAAVQLTVRPAQGMTAAPAGQDAAEVSFADGPTVVAAIGASLLDVAERAGVAIEAGCRLGACGSDPILVHEGGENLSPVTAAEAQTLERLGLDERCRMACAARVRGTVRVSTDTRTRPTRPSAARTGGDPSVERVVIIGNGIAGVTAADHARRHHPTAAIDIVAEEAQPLYNRMGVSRLIYGRSAMSGLHLLPESWYSDRQITCWLNTQAHAIDRESRVVTLGTGETLHYDRLVLAMGASARVPAVPGADGALVIRTAADAMALREIAQRRAAREAVVIGGGLLGLEAAHALRQFGLRATVIDRAPRLLPRCLDSRASELLARYFASVPVDILPAAEPQSVDSSNGSVQLADGRDIRADIVVVCAGITPNVSLARAAGLDVGTGVVVDFSMRTSDEAIYAAGDVAECGFPPPGLWPVAVEQGKVAGTNAAGGCLTYSAVPTRMLLKGVGISVQSAGVLEPEPGDDVEVEDAPEDDVRYRKVIRRGGHTIGAVFIGDWPDAEDVLSTVSVPVPDQTVVSLAETREAARL